MTTVKDRTLASKYAKPLLDYNAAVRQLAASRCALQGFEVRITPEVQGVLDGGTLNGRDAAKHERDLRERYARLREAVDSAVTDWHFMHRAAEASLGRPLTEDELLRGFGSPVPDGALSEARPWDENYRVPGYEWKPGPMPPPETRWKLLAEGVARIGVIPEEPVAKPEPIPLPAVSVEEQLDTLRKAYAQTAAALAVAETDAERDALRGTLAALAAEAAALKGGAE